MRDGRPGFGLGLAAALVSCAVAGFPCRAFATSPGAAPRSSASSFPVKTAGGGSIWLPHGAPMPDSVLAEVGTRRVTAARFRRGWAQVQPPARPDSITPENVRRFLEILMDKEVLAIRAMSERWHWTPEESAQYAGLRDRLMLQSALDSELRAAAAARAAAGDTTRNVETLGIAAREEAVARLGPVFDEELLGRLAESFAALPRPSPDSSLWAQLRAMGASPAVAPGDTGRVLARTRAGDYRVSELLASWQRLNPLYRPRIESASQVRDLVKNGLYERLLRREAERRRLDRGPAVAAALAERREYIAVSHLVAREVYARLPLDSLTLLGFFESHRPDFALPERVRVIQLVLPSPGEAAAMLPRLAGQAEAESLLVRARRAGVDYSGEFAAEQDSTLFATAKRLGAGALIGPDSTARGWRIARVEAVLPSRERDFSEARELVLHRWYGEEGERRMRELVEGLRRHTRLVVNPRAIERLVRDWPAPH